MQTTRALLLTDVVDSTQLSQRLGDAAMMALWSAHDRAARDLLPRHRGREIDKTDGMLLLFERADDALAYASAYHAALAQLDPPLRARAGLHVGPVLLRENNADDVARGAKPLEVDGLAKPTAARVMSVARGGQTLASAPAMQAINGAAPAGLHSRSHGHWVMKGVDEPLELFEVGPDPARFAPPPDGDKVYRVVQRDGRWLPVRQVPNNLPEQLSSFVGREQELGELRGLLRDARLLSLLGMGGLGKTRLSLQLAAEAMAEYPDGVWFVDLAPLRDDALVAAEAAQALGVREEPGTPLLQTLAAHLRDRCTLLVLDNCEHLLRPAALLVHALLKAAPRLTVLASSRAALRVPGERCYALQPLPLPERDAPVETLARSTAVRLFVARAQEHRHGFALDAAQAPAVAELVARLEGIPLALELAAARVATMAVAEINQRLADRYAVLTEGSIVLEERQQTLRALVDWSHDLLADDERALFRRLSLHAGGFDAEAAAAVAGDAPLAPDQVPALLASLADKSLLNRVAGAEAPRWRMLETLRDYARERLAAHNETAPFAERHCAHYFVVAKAVKNGLLGAQQAQWVRRGELELDNLRAAMALALAGGTDAFIAVKLAVALQGFWQQRGYAREGREAVRRALALPAVAASPLAKSHALYVDAMLSHSLGEPAEAVRQLQACLALRRELGAPVEIAATLSTLGMALLQAGDAAAAREHDAEALRLFTELGDKRGMAIGHEHLAMCALHAADDAEAQAQGERGLALAQRIGYHECAVTCQLLLGAVAFERGDLDRAARLGADALALARDSGNRREEAKALRARARLALARGDAEAACAPLAEALQVFVDFDARAELQASVEDGARLAALRGQAELALALSAAAEGLRERYGLARPPRLAARWAAQQQALKDTLGERAARALHEGQGWSADEALARLRPLLAASAGAAAPGPGGR